MKSGARRATCAGGEQSGDLVTTLAGSPRTDGPAIAVEDLSRAFGAVQALDGVSFAIARGEVVGLLGHNGAGKTTTIRLLNGLLDPDRGNVRVLELDPAEAGAEIRARTGVLTETPSLDERLTARENLAFSAELFAVERSRTRARVEALLAQFDLAARADDRVAGFSRGMKQRLALARALVHDPALLFLDEPTAALDPVAAREVHALIRRLAGDPDRTVVISTHNLVEAQRLCDRVLILRQGQLIAAGTPSDLARRIAGRSRIELEVDEAHVSAATAVVGQLEPRASVVDDRGVMAVTGIGRELVPDLIRQLVAAGVDVYRLDAAEASLEEVYFALHEREVGE